MYINLLSFVALVSTCRSAAVLKGKKEEVKYKDIPGRYGDNTDDSGIPGRYGDFSKKHFSNREVSSSRRSDIPGRYGDYSKTSLVPGRHGDTSIRGILKRSNGVKTYFANYDNNLFDDASMSQQYVMLNSDSSPNLPGRYAGDELNKKYLNENKLSLLRKYNADTKQMDAVVNMRRIPGRYGDEEKNEVNKDIPGRYGDDSTRKDNDDNSRTYGNEEIPEKYGNIPSQMDDKIIPGRYGDGKTNKDTKNIPGRYGDEKTRLVEEGHDDNRQRDTILIPGRYGDERRFENIAQTSKQYPGKYGDEMLEKKIVLNENGIPGRYGDERFLVEIPGRYGDDRARKFFLNKGDENVSNVNAKKKKKYRYKSISTKFANQGHRDSAAINKRIIHSV